MNPKRVIAAAAICCGICACLAQTRPRPGEPQPASSQAPRPQRFEYAPVPLDSRAVDAAIEKGMKYLYSRQSSAGVWPPFGEPSQKWHYSQEGPTALATFALLTCGAKAGDQPLAKAVEFLRRCDTPRTYSLGLMCNIWLALGDRQLLQRDVMRLVKGSKAGTYTYWAGEDYQTDNSNGQYGVLGVWAGALADVEVPEAYWREVLDHWQGSQNGDGGWGYTPNSSTTHTMTAAGVASALVCIDNLMMDKFLKCQVDHEVMQPVERGLEAMVRQLPRSLDFEMNKQYYLFSLERVGLASGMKYFGSFDWYKTIAAKLLASQQPSGAWSGDRDDVISTSFALLFLARGRHPVIFNRLQHSGDWNNRPRALAAATRWIGRTFETTVNWQNVPIDAPVEEWADAPVLLLTGCGPPQFDRQQLDKLRRHVLRGGSIVSIAEGNGAAFSAGMREIYKELFPQYPLARALPSHPLNNAYFKLPGKPVFDVVSNGVRPLAIHCDEDLTLAWTMRNIATQKYAFEAAANLFMYVTDRASLMHARGGNVWPAKPSAPSKRSVSVARLAYEGNWDAEPLAYERFARLLARQANLDAKVLSPVAIENLPTERPAVATLTGTDKFALSDSQMQALKAYVQGGGTLLVEAVGGSREFAVSAERMLQDLFGASALRRLADDSPLYRQVGLEIDQVTYRRASRRRLGGQRSPRLRAVLVDGRPAVIFSAEDITTGLLGCAVLDINGYECSDGGDGGSAYRIMRNIVCWAAGPDGAASSPASAAARSDH